MFGLDHVWGMAGNTIVFNNSLKMKLAVVLGILHMSFGIVLRGLNAIYFGSAVDFICEFIPQLLFFGGLFGYMVLLIFMKWVTNWTEPLSWEGKHGKVPQIIATFSQIYSNPAAAGKLPIIGYNGWSQAAEDNPGVLQQYIQLGIVGIALIMVFVILIPKPFIVSGQQKRAQKEWESKHPKGTQESSDEDLQEKLIDKEQEELDAPESPEPFGELMIHQLIETIEFVLGSISNTASYLRLWALSLAHSQLAGTFLDLILKKFLTKPTNVYVSTPIIIFTSAGLLCTTFAVLMVMDTAECFLHTLRLHWVEFQNKFFKGDGLNYAPLSFENRLPIETGTVDE